MDKLPTEILSEILSHLHQQDKVQCMLTCQKYAAAVCRGSLFRTVRLSTLAGLKHFTALVEQDQSKGEEVEQLVLDYDIDEDIDVHALFQLLPNVRAVILNDSLHYNFVNEEGSSHGATACDTFLTKLCCNDQDGNVIAALPNAPALEKLIICPGDVVMLSTLEAIHKNAPNLKHLMVRTLSLGGSDLDYQVSPAPLITTFETEQSEQTLITAEYDLLDYIDKKYPNVTRLDYCNDSEGEVEDIDELFNTRWVPLLRKLGLQLIKLYTYCDERLVDFLNYNGCTYPVNELRFGGISSQKLNQLRNVDFLHDLNVVLREPWEFDWLSQLTVLKKLQLECRIYKDTNLPSLNNILTSCPPSLKTLMLESGTYTIQPLDIHAVNVKYLSFKIVTLPNGIDTFISTQIPTLHL